MKASAGPGFWQKSFKIFKPRCESILFRAARELQAAGREHIGVHQR